MARLGPWSAERRVAVAVSGGPDSLALALLASQWARGRSKPVALVVDHGLRAASAAEARWAHDTLRRFGLPVELLRLDGLHPGSGLQARARALRYEALREACRRRELLDLLLGHHRDDQEETAIMRARAGSGPDGRAGMAGVSERTSLRLLRPLLGVAPARLRAPRRAASLAGLAAPRQRDDRFARARLRHEHARGGRDLVALDDTERAGRARSRGARDVAASIAACVTVTEEGVAILPGGALPAPVLRRLLQALGGRDHPPPTEVVERLAAAPRACTLAGVAVLAHSSPHGAWLLCRERAAMAPPVAARLGATWDRRFRLSGRAELPDGWRLGALGRASAGLRDRSPLPADALATLPALFDAAGALRAVPHLDHFYDVPRDKFEVIFSPPVPVVPSFFTPFGDAHG